MNWLELPLLKRELIEMAQRRRTYVLRCLCLAVFSLVFLTLYVEQMSRAYNITRMLGQGRIINEVLFVTLMVTIYALAPAMACSAITSEKEKQTLGLLLISRLNPWGIVLEKLSSRMLPLLSLIIVSAPLFGIAYLLGGISFADSATGIAILLFTLFQLVSVAIFCSALLESGIAAFWGTYIVLAVLYFTLPILVEAEILPRFQLSANLRDSEFLFFPAYQLAMLMDSSRSTGDILWLTVPQLLVTLLFVMAARVALIRYSLGAAFSPGKQFAHLRAMVFAPLRKLVRRGRRRPENDEASALPEPAAAGLPSQNALSWRERKASVVVRPRMVLMFTGLLILLEWWVLSASNKYNRDDFCALMSFGVLIISLLIVLGIASKLFAKERERQTLDSLLVAPFTNTELLRGKASVANRLILMLLIPVFVTCLFNLEYSRYGRNRIDSAPLTYLFCAVGNAFIYMHLVKWIALYFGLRLNTQMKAMVGSLVTVLVICFVPLMTMVMLMILYDSNPNRFPPFFFSSPMIIPALNEFHDLDEVSRNSSVLTELLAVIFNLAIYGGLMLVVRRLVQFQLPDLLDRLDQPQRAFRAVGLSEISVPAESLPQ